MGVTKAAQDAMALVDCIASEGPGPAATSAYEQQRLRAGQAVVQRGRELGAYMQSQANPTAAAVNRSAEAVLRMTAVDPGAAG
jgi:2-polyprenyl-6-methoxyphenol hydroxylase-like FAD-dependent oxidoreductase